MALKITYVVFALLAGSFAVPVPELDTSVLFEHVDTNARIVGGTPAATGAHPHMVALSQGTMIRSFMCGGSILSERTILTAAHCIAAAFNFGSLSNTLRGTVGTNTWNLGGQSHAFSGNATHLLYDRDLITYDIGVLYTATSLMLSASVAPVSLNFDYIDGGVLTRAAGWGRIRAGGPISANLLELETWTLGGQQCVEEAALATVTLNMTAPPVDPEVMLCVYHSVGHGMCNGDSGSALVRVADGLQVGIVSWGFPCAIGGPDMFVRVSAFRNWLDQHTI